jgi:hypothetical protein
VPNSTKPGPRRSDANPVSEAIGLVKTYVRQNTVDELKPALRFIGFGVPGAALLSIGGVLVTLGLLRFLQGSDGQRWSRGWSWLPYVITMAVCLVGVAIAIILIRRPSLARRGGARPGSDGKEGRR